MKTFVPGEEISVKDDQRKRLAESGISVPTVEHVKAAQTAYEKIPFGAFYFRPANQTEQAPFTHVSKKTCIGVSYEDGSGYGMYSSYPVWVKDPSISISWNTGLEKFHCPVIYTYLDHNVWIGRTKVLEYQELRMAIKRDFKKWSRKVPQTRRRSTYYGAAGFFNFQESMDCFGREPGCLTQVLGIDNGEDLFRFIIRFLNQREPLFIGNQANWQFIKEHKDQLKSLFGITTLKERREAEKRCAWY